MCIRDSFAPFPRHSHNYVEIMYMCRGKTVHRIDGDARVTLEAGELLFLNRHASHAIQRADAGEDVYKRQVTVSAEAGTFYYQANLKDAQLPWNISVAYMLD